MKYSFLVVFAQLLVMIVAAQQVKAGEESELSSSNRLGYVPLTSFPTVKSAGKHLVYSQITKADYGSKNGLALIDSVKKTPEKKPSFVRDMPGYPSLRQIAPDISRYSLKPPKQLTAEEKKIIFIVQKAVERIHINYPDKVHHLQGFYRMVATENQAYTKLVEAAFTMQETNYKTDYNRNNIKVNLLHLRQSQEWGKLDSMVMLGKKRMVNAIARVDPNLAVGNYLYRMPRSSPIRLAYLKNTLLNYESNFALSHNFKMLDKTIIGQDTILKLGYVDDFSSTTTGYLKINTTDFAIVELQRTNNLFNTFIETVEVRYDKFNGKYYPVFMKMVVPRLINTDAETYQVDIHSVWFEKPLTRKYAGSKPKNYLDWTAKLETQKWRHDPGFWTNNKLLQQHPLEPEIRKSLEFKDSLEYQFREKASKVKY